MNSENQSLIDDKQNFSDYEGQRQRQRSRLEWAEASWRRILHILSWSWMYSTLLLGYKRKLTDDDLEDLPQDDNGNTLLNRLHRYSWKKTSTFRILIQAFSKESLLVGFLLMPRMAARIGKSLLLRELVFFISSHETSPLTSTSVLIAYLAALGLFVCTLIEICAYHRFLFQSARIGLKIRNALTSVIYKHLLSVNLASFEQTTAAKTINLIAHDTARFEYLNMSIHYLWQAPLEAIIVFVLLCWITGPLTASMGYIILLMLIPVQVIFSQQFNRFCTRAAIYTDQRIHGVNELVHGCHVIKMYNWEKPIEERLLKMRENELINIQRASHVRALNMGIFFLSTPLMALATFGGIWWIGQPLHPANVFSILVLYNQIRMPVLRYFPQAIERLIEGRIASKRIDEFMRLATVIEDYSPSISRINSDQQEKGSIIMHNASFSWNNTDICLSALNIKIHPGTFVGIIGPVGSGKSSLLEAILGEINLVSGHLNTNNSSFAYAAQTPWILPDTFRENILLGRAFDEQRYTNVIRACCLDTDISNFGASGDLTVIGENGINLSGGQKARLSLARTLYADVDIYLLDDPLGAVDRTVAMRIYNQCIGPHGLLSKKTRLLITHQIQFLRESDQTILLTLGRIQAQGRLDELPIQYEDIESAESAGTNEGAALANILDIKNSFIDTRSIIVDEISSNTSTNYSLWISLFTASSLGLFGLVLLIFLLVISEAFYDTTNYWLSIWSKKSYVVQQSQVDIVYIYLGLTLATIITALIRVDYCFYLILKGSNKLHNNMLTKLLYTSLRFYENNPSGRILNRASKDQKIVDEILGVTWFDAIQSLLIAAGSIVIIGIVNPWVLLLLVPVVPTCWILSRFYLRTSRQLKQLENISRSPIYTLFSSSLNGLSTIRAFKIKDTFLELFLNKLDANARSYLIQIGAGHWLGFWLDFLMSLFILLTAILAIVLRDQIDPSAVALGLSSSINMTLWFQWGIRQLVESDTLMTSVERIDQYARLPNEEDEGGQKRLIKTSEDWPNQGIIEFRNYSLRYRSGLEFALKDINLYIKSAEKIGIIGRTGAGKSSLFEGLLRFVDRSMIDGEILIDNVDISRITLYHLRSHLSIIPQLPILFSGTIRYNLDPFDHYSDEECWMALEAVQLKKMVSNHQAGLLLPVAEFGKNLSVGQCQLVCVARAILKNSKILLIDEATANVDRETDKLIQEVIKEKFRGQTVLTIAHRLNTVVSTDRLIVLDNGRIVASDTPNNILPNL